MRWVQMRKKHLEPGFANLSPSETLYSRGSLLDHSSRNDSDSSSSLETYQRSPLRCLNPPCPLPIQPRSYLRHRAATLDTCSALAGSHDCDGLLHDGPCGFVAPRIQPWGSPCFGPALTRETFPDGAEPFEAFPSLAAVAVSPPFLPSRRCSVVAFLPCCHVRPHLRRPSTSRPFPPESP